MAEENMLRDNYEWFEKKLPELIEVYEDQYVVIKNKNVLAAYSSFEKAFDETIKTEVPGTFIIQLCSLDESKTVQKFYTPRVSFVS